MEYLDTVKERIADYIAKDEVVENDDIISAYTLFSAIENCKKRLRHVEEIEKGLVDKLNDIYPQKTIKVKKGLFNKKTKVDYFNGARHYINENCTELCISSEHNWATLKKDYNYSDIYSTSDTLTDEAYTECSDELIAIFSELDYFGRLYSKDTNKITDGRSNPLYSRISNKINCEGFDLKVLFNNDYSVPEFGYGIELNEKIAPNGHEGAHFYGKDNNIENIINDNMVAILKNTPVNINKLNYMFYIIVSDYRTMTKQDRIDEEIDKAFQKIYEKK